MRTRLLAIIVVAAATFTAAAPGTAEAAAGAQSKTLKPSDGTSTTTRISLALGDSIVAGYCGLFCRLDSYGVFYSQDIANGFDAQVDYRGHAQSGEVMSQIADRTASNVASVQVADYIVLEGCGNDFLNARSTYRGQSDCTNETVLASALTTCNTNMVRALNTIAANKKPSAKVRVLLLYYPGVAADKARACGTRTHFDVFLNYLLQAGWTTCNEAWKRGFECVDGFAGFNAADVDTSLDPDSSIDSDQIRINEGTDRDNFAGYKNRVMASKAVISDAHSKRTSATTTVDYLQSDDTHPTTAGHHRLADEHTDVGL